MNAIYDTLSNAGLESDLRLRLFALSIAVAFAGLFTVLSAVSLALLLVTVEERSISPTSNCFVGPMRGGADEVRPENVFAHPSRPLERLSRGQKSRSCTWTFRDQEASACRTCECDVAPIQGQRLDDHLSLTAASDLFNAKLQVWILSDRESLVDSELLDGRDVECREQVLEIRGKRGERDRGGRGR